MKRVICALPVISVMPWSGRTVVAAYAMTAGWNIATATAGNVFVEKMLLANDAITVHPIIMVSVLAMDVDHATAAWPRRVANATEKRDSANACQVSPVADATSASRDIGIMDVMDAHVRPFLTTISYFYKYRE